MSLRGPCNLTMNYVYDFRPLSGRAPLARMGKRGRRVERRAALVASEGRPQWHRGGGPYRLRRALRRLCRRATCRCGFTGRAARWASRVVPAPASLVNRHTREPGELLRESVPCGGKLAGSGSRTRGTALSRMVSQWPCENLTAPSSVRGAALNARHHGPGKRAQSRTRPARRGHDSVPRSRIVMRKSPEPGHSDFSRERLS
jgi:hypothetical protein